MAGMSMMEGECGVRSERWADWENARLHSRLDHVKRVEAHPVHEARSATGDEEMLRRGLIEACRFGEVRLRAGSSGSAVGQRCVAARPRVNNSGHTSGGARPERDEICGGAPSCARMCRSRPRRRGCCAQQSR